MDKHIVVYSYICTLESYYIETTRNEVLMHTTTWDLSGKKNSEHQKVDTEDVGFHFYRVQGLAVLMRGGRGQNRRNCCRFLIAKVGSEASWGSGNVLYPDLGHGYRGGKRR